MSYQTSQKSSEDPDPLDRPPAGALFVPVRSGPGSSTACCRTTRFFRTPLGTRTAVAFTSEERLVRTLGARQPWIRLSEAALRALAAPLGVTALRIDPRLTAPAPVHATAPAPDGGRPEQAASPALAS
ncbi:SAV_915 family protein [Streptomyces sp. NPDC003300]|uniref:SAV_915 family protein n=1 Tax=unclassified Streptomyces TaxID=2593676 RepID=UPI0033AA519D